MEQSYVNVVSSFLPNIVFLLIGLARNKYNHFLNNKDPRITKIIFHMLFVIWFVINYFSMRMALGDDEWILGSIVCFVLSSVVLYYFVYHDLSQFWDVGFWGADKKTSSGIDYEKSLRLCKHQLSFLGVGASKLTKAKEFENTLVNCRRDKSIKFLLFKPTSEHLQSAAKRADKSYDKYQQIVIESLRKIADLKKSRCENIEVRFYSGNPIFRLMFIDNSVCLVGSYTSFGIGDGSESPQVHIRNSSEQNNADSFYRPFEFYYDDIWRKSEPWDFKEFLN